MINLFREKKIMREYLRSRTSRSTYMFVTFIIFPPSIDNYSVLNVNEILVLRSWISHPRILRKKRLCYHDMPCKIMYSALKSSKMTAFYCNGEKYLYVQQIYFLWRFYVGLFDGICVGVSHKCAFEQLSDSKEISNAFIHIFTEKCMYVGRYSIFLW